MAEKKKSTKDQLVPTHKSIHVVFFSCAHCGDEVQDVKLCPSCGEPMRVINVVEKFGEEAEKFLADLKKNTNGFKNEEEEEEDYVSIDKEEPNIILMGGESASIDDGGIDPSVVDDDGGLDVIFPDDGEDGPVKVEALDDGELAQALEQLDSEEEDVSADDFGDIPEL